MRRRSSLFYHVSTTIDGIENSLYEGIKIAHQNNNIEILDEIISVITNSIYTSIDTSNIIVYERSLILLERLYKIALTQGDHSSYLKRTSHNSIKEKISFILYRIENNVYDSSESLIIEFLKLAFTSLNRILHDILINKDYDTYKDATYEFYTFIFDKYRYHESKSNLLIYQIEYYVNSVAILQYSWILYLYKNGKFNQSECLDFLKENKLLFRNYERILDTLIYIDTLPFGTVFGVGDWEEDLGKINRSTTMGRSTLSPTYWATSGMMIYLIRNISIVTNEINPTRIRSIEKLFEFYFKDFQNRLQEIKENKDLWIPIIFDNAASVFSTNNDTLSIQINSYETEFFKRIDNISNALKNAEIQLSKIELIKDNEKLADRPLSETKIIEFRESVGNEWYRRSFLHRLFDAYFNYKEIDDSPTVPISRIFVFRIGPKKMFIDGGIPMLGSTDSGNIIANHEDGEFLKSIKTLDTPIRLFNNIIKCLDTLIENIKTDKFNPSVIILGSSISHLIDDLISNENFIPRWKVKDELGASKSEYALYKQIPVYTSYNQDFNEYVIVADFKNAFILNQVRNEQWYKNQLQVETMLVDDKEAKRIFDENPDDWKVSSKGIELSEAESLTYIKTGIIWDINVKEIFEVKNPLAYAIGQIKIDQDV
jgi:hypothetical protein